MVLVLRILALIALACGVAACASTDRGVAMAPGIEVAQLEGLPVPETAATYTIQANDTLEVLVSESELLSGEFLVDSGGYVSYPLIGDLYLTGKTPGQAAQLLSDRLRGEYILDPQVRVRPKNVPNASITVGGEVARPGTQTHATSPSLLRAIYNAGGLGEFAKSDDVLVMRTAQGRKYIGVYNIEAIQRGNYKDPALYPNDIVTVGDSPGRKRLQTILQFFPLLSSSLILVDRAIQ